MSAFIPCILKISPSICKAVSFACTVLVCLPLLLFEIPQAMIFGSDVRGCGPALFYAARYYGQAAKRVINFVLSF